MADVYTVVESYAEYIETLSKPLWRRFQKTRRDAPESAIAEAVTFRVLQQCRAIPTIADMLNKGGPDFLCMGGTKQQFMVEATSFLPRKVTDDTALQNSPPDEIRVQAFSLLTQQIDEKATQKKRQFDALTMPGILAIASNHFGANMVLNSMAATNALVSQPFWVGGQDEMSTDLGSSIFLRLENTGEIVAKNTSISAVILIAVMYDGSRVCGAINPAAKNRIDTSPLWEIPFVYLKDWPIENRKARCEWTMGSQRSHIVPHASIRRA